MNLTPRSKNVFSCKCIAWLEKKAGFSVGSPIDCSLVIFISQPMFVAGTLKIHLNVCLTDGYKIKSKILRGQILPFWPFVYLPPFATLA